MATQATTRKILQNEVTIQRATKLLEAAYGMACDPNEGGAIRLGAMKLYLAKTMPDLKAIEHSGGLDVDMQVTAIEVRYVDSSDRDA